MPTTVHTECYVLGNLLHNLIKQMLLLSTFLSKRNINPIYNLKVYGNTNETLHLRIRGVNFNFVVPGVYGTRALTFRMFDNFKNKRFKKFMHSIWSGHKKKILPLQLRCIVVVFFTQVYLSYYQTTRKILEKKTERSGHPRTVRTPVEIKAVKE